MTKSDEEAVEEADDWSDTIPSSASASHGLDSARSASASVMRLEVGAGANPILKKGARFIRFPSIGAMNASYSNFLHIRLLR